jgi:phosphodiesterase/alkaline phosphatase D-like protein
MLNLEYKHWVGEITLDKMQKKVAKVMREYKAGGLHSGKGGPVVKSQKQAVAIAMSEAGYKQKEKK